MNSLKVMGPRLRSEEQGSNFQRRGHLQKWVTDPTQRFWRCATGIVDKRSLVFGPVMGQIQELRMDTNRERTDFAVASRRRLWGRLKASCKVREVHCREGLYDVDDKFDRKWVIEL